MHPLKTGLEEGVPIQAYMQIHADTCRYMQIQTDMNSPQDTYKIYTRYAHTYRYAHDKTSKNRYACNKTPV
jgi:hypothetical protein